MAETPSLRKGRPQDAGKRDRILDAVRALVDVQGFAGASIEGVAALAGVSKVTIYNQFTDRTGLFAAMIARESAWMEAGLSRLMEGVVPDPAGLEALGVRLAQFWARPEVARLDLQIALAGAELAGLKAAFFAAGPARLHAALTGVLSALGVRAPAVAAEQLVALWRAAVPEAVRFGVAAADMAEVEARARAGTHVFLRGYEVN